MPTSHLRMNELERQQKHKQTKEDHKNKPGITTRRGG